ncbi:AAA family ATPase [Candidatus Bipolaricaulota bacterium]|nr:AAA family ATPase [Candidatus Bipolaricaulota bacterium]
MKETVQFTRVDFKRFKAFESFRLNLRQFNILVGPNNAGKSTVLAAFRILAAAMRKANRRKPQVLSGMPGHLRGYVLDLSAGPVVQENIFYNYEDSEPASVTFHLANRNRLVLWFPAQGICHLYADDQSRQILSPSSFRTRFNCPIGFVPILGPVEQHERLFGREAARQALYHNTAARNFRNIWYHYPERFDSFRSLVQQTWPGMDVERPEIDMSYEKTLLRMFCPEERIPRELFWAGFGFQVWCQMLTHVVQSTDVSMFLIDEPDIYLHSDLQRQLLSLLRNLGPDVLIATHSTEIISEAEANDIVLIDKKRKSARRIREPSELGEVFSFLGSNLNPTLTQLAKTRRALFVEGKDFQILSKYARKLGNRDIGNRSTFAVIPVEGFSPDRIRSLKRGIEVTLGGKVSAAAILDRDYRSADECSAIQTDCEKFCSLVVIHLCKEVENLLLVPSALDRAASRRVRDQAQRTGKSLTYVACAGELIGEFAAEMKSYVMSQYLARRRNFTRRSLKSREDEAVTNQQALEEFDEEWGDEARRIEMIPGKDALSMLNRSLQPKYGVSITPTAIIDSMHSDEIPDSVRELMLKLSEFSTARRSC